MSLPWQTSGLISAMAAINESGMYASLSIIILTSAGTELPLDYTAVPFIYQALSILLEGGHIPHYTHKCSVCDPDLKNIHMAFLVWY
jgi:hypothetical protein